MDAYQELMDALEEGEVVKGIVFGAYGWGSVPEDGQSWYVNPDHDPDPLAVPLNVRGQVLSLKDAEPYMHGWQFEGSWGMPECYAVYIWTDRRIFWVSQYDGSSELCSAPRDPTDTVPEMSGGG